MRVHEIHPMTPPEGFPPDKPMVYPQEVVMQYDGDAGMWVVSGNGELLCVTPHFWLAESINLLLATTEASVAAIQTIEDGGVEVKSAELTRSLPSVFGRVDYEPPPVQFPLNVEVEPYGGRYWAVMVNGQLLCVTLYRRGAEAVRGFLHGIEREVMERQVISVPEADIIKIKRITNPDVADDAKVAVQTLQREIRAYQKKLQQTPANVGGN